MVETDLMTSSSLSLNQLIYFYKKLFPRDEWLGFHCLLKLVELIDKPSPPQDERLRKEGGVPMENQVLKICWTSALYIFLSDMEVERKSRPQKAEKLLKHLLLGNRYLNNLLVYLYLKRPTMNKAVLFDVLFSKRYRDLLFTVLNKSRFLNKAEALDRFMDLLLQMGRGNPKLEEELSLSEMDRHAMEYAISDIVIYHPIQKMADHLLLENSELEEWHLKETLFPEGEMVRDYPVEQLMQHLLLGCPELDRGDMLDILYLSSAREKKDDLENLLEHLLEHLLRKNPELKPEDLLDILFYERFRSEVLNILPRIQNKKMKVRGLDMPKSIPYFRSLLKGVLEKAGDFQEVDALYSKRSRDKLNLMLGIAERMGLSHVIKHDVVSSDDVSLRELGKEVSRLAANRMRLSSYDLSWLRSICYPLPRDSISDMLRGKWVDELDKLEDVVLSGRWKSRWKGSPDEVESLNLTTVVSLLPFGGTLVDPTGERIVLEPDTFHRKYVMIFCIDAPALFREDITSCQPLLNLCNELSSERADDVKMVMVARMNILADTEDVFNHLFSGFPTSCLAIPYEDWERREHVCNLLKCGSDEIRCSVYNNTDGSFLATFCVKAKNPYGAEAFPFTRERLEEIDEMRKGLQYDSLDKLLRPYSYPYPDVVVYKLDSPQVKSSISEVMKGKHVGLYVCCDGGFIPRLRKLYLHCKENRKEFEIVVLYLPLFSAIDPDLFKEKIETRLRNHNISGWCLPFNNSVSQRIWSMTMDYDCDYNGDNEWMDKLIIVGTDGKILDLYGSVVINTYDGYDAYPYTREAVVKKELEELKKVRLELLLPDELFRGNNSNDTVFAKDLVSRVEKVFIFLGQRKHVYKSRLCSFDYEGFVSGYETMKARGGEVVFIEWRDGEGEVDKFADMPWYVYPHFAPLVDKLKESVEDESLVGFDKDGCVCSVQSLYGTVVPCFEDTLEDDIYQLLNINRIGNDRLAKISSIL